MIVGSQPRISNIVTNPTIELGDSAIKRVAKAKTLWNDQIQNMLKKASKGVGMMRRIKKYVLQ